jgi:hypothetical protein
MNFEAGTFPTSFAEARLGERIPPNAKAAAPAPAFLMKARLDIPVLFILHFLIAFPPFFVVHVAMQIICTKLL